MAKVADVLKAYQYERLGQELSGANDSWVQQVEIRFWAIVRALYEEQELGDDYSGDIEADLQELDQEVELAPSIAGLFVQVCKFLASNQIRHSRGVLGRVIPTSIQSNNSHDEQVQSLGFVGGDGHRRTIGVMLPGSYTFTTEQAENILVHCGELHVGYDDRNQGFLCLDPLSSRLRIAANQKVHFTVFVPTHYTCIYGDLPADFGFGQ